MILKDLEILKKDELGVYDLGVETWEIPEGSQFGRYTVQKGEVMRIDLVSESIYGNSENSDILLNINLISNPLNIKEGMDIIFPINNIDLFRKTITNDSAVISIKRKNSDSYNKNRADKEKWDKSGLPPTILSKPTKQISISDNSIVLGSGLI
jgi:hypothetical protein